MSKKIFPIDIIRKFLYYFSAKLTAALFLRFKRAENRKTLGFGLTFFKDFITIHYDPNN